MGYRVKSQRGVQFRIWVTQMLKEYLRKGFALDDELRKGHIHKHVIFKLEG